MKHINETAQPVNAAIITEVDVFAFVALAAKKVTAHTLREQAAELEGGTL